MAKAKVKLPIGEFELEGTQPEVSGLLRDLIDKSKVESGVASVLEELQEVVSDVTLKVLPTPKDLPFTNQIKEFILQQERFRHTVPQVTQHFLKRTFASKVGGAERQTFRQIYGRIRKAQRSIAREHNGEWKHTTKKRVREYYFVKKDSKEGGG